MYKLGEDSTSLLAEVQQRLNYDQKSYDFWKKPHLLQLVILDYRPIVRRSNGIEEYLYIDAYDESGSMYFMQRRSLKLTKDGEIAQKSCGTLDSMMAELASEYNFIKEASILFNSPIEDGTVPEDGKIIKMGSYGDVKFCRRNYELQALLFETSEFSSLESIVLNGTNTNRVGYFAIGERMPAKGSLIQRQEWLRRVYNTWMLYRNIDLATYYYTNLVPPNIEAYFELNRVCTFDEYVPLIYQFTSIYNPLIDDGCIFDNVSKIFSAAIQVSPLSMVGGNIYSVARDQKESFGLYTTRLEMSNLFQTSVGKYKTRELQREGRLPMKTHKQTKDFYYPKYFLTVFLTQLIDATDYRDMFILYSLSDDVTVYYTEEQITVDDGARWDFQNINLHSLDFGNDDLTGFSKRRIRFSDALFLKYMSVVFNAVDAQRAWSRHASLAVIEEDKMEVR